MRLLELGRISRPTLRSDLILATQAMLSCDGNCDVTIRQLNKESGLPRTNSYVAPALFCALLVCYPAMGDEPRTVDWAVRPVGLRLVAELPEQPDFPRPFNQFTGTRIVFQCSPHEGYILGHVENQSSIDRFADELGNDLRKPNAQRLSDKTTIGHGGYSKDRKHALMEVFGAKVPDDRAKSINFRGNLAFVVAGNRKTHDFENVSLKVGVEFSVGDHKILVKEVRQPNANRPAIVVTTRAKGHIGDIRFFDVNGNDLAARKVGWHIVTSEKLDTANDTDWRLSEKPAVINLEVDEWLDVDTVLVPIDVRLSVGLPTNLGD